MWVRGVSNHHWHTHTCLRWIVLGYPHGPVMPGVGVFLFGFVVEWVADAQKLSFNQGGAAKNKWIQHGLWR